MCRELAKHINFHYVDTKEYENDGNCLNYGYWRLLNHLERSNTIQKTVNQFGIPNFIYVNKKDFQNERIELYYVENDKALVFEYTGKNGDIAKLIDSRKISSYERTQWYGLILDRVPKLPKK